MMEKSSHYSRPLFISVLMCAAVMSFIMCSDAARADPITTQMVGGVKHNVLRRPYAPYSQRHPLLTAPLPPETELQTGTSGETEIDGNNRKGLSIIDRQSSSLQFTEGSFGNSQNIPDNRETWARLTGSQGGIKPASSIFYSQHGGQNFERQPSGVNYHPGSGNSHKSHSVIIGKPSHKDSLFHQSSRSTQVWDSKDAQKSYNKEKVLRSDSQKPKDKSVWQPSDSSLLSSKTSRFWSPSLPTPIGHYSVYKETNELSAAGVQSTSRGIQSSKFLSFASQTAPRAPSVSSNLDAPVIKSNPSPEKLTSSITDFSKGLHSMSNTEAPKYKKGQSYLFKDSHASPNTVTNEVQNAPHEQRPSDAQVYSRFASNLKKLHQSQRKPTEEVQHLTNKVSPVYHRTNTASYGAQRDSFINTAAAHIPPRKGNLMESFDFQGSYTAESKRSGVTSLVNTTARGPTNAYRPGRTIKSIYGFTGFKNPLTGAASSSGSSERTNSQRHSFDKGKFRITNVYPSLTAKYSFGQREASTTTTTPAKRERTHYSSSGTVDIFQTVATERPFTSGLKEDQPLLPESDAAVDGKPDRSRLGIFRRIYGLKGFDTRPLEGAKTLLSEPDKSARVQQGFEGFKLMRSHMWQPRSSWNYTWNNKMGERGSGSSRESTVRQNEISSEDLKPHLQTAGGTKSVPKFTSDKSSKIYTLLGYQPRRNRTGNAFNKTQQNPATAVTKITSAYLRSAGGPKDESSPKSELTTQNQTKTDAKIPSLLNRSTSSSVRAQRVKVKLADAKKLSESTSVTDRPRNVAIVRLPKVKVVTHTDILGSASFSHARTTTRAPTTLADKGYSPDVTATTKQKPLAAHSEYNTSRAPEAHAGDEETDFSSMDENKPGVRSEEADRDMKTYALFLDTEGSGSGAFNMPDVVSADSTNSQGLGEDLLELDYLRISTGNISFKSMKMSHTGAREKPVM